MADDDNAVNTDRRYHHGDLRAALVAEGLRLIAENNADALSLREVARRAGVSATAVYRHFPDKRALMTALALDGLARLGAAQRDAAATAGGGEAGFAATGRAYVRFALAHPALFRLIFASPLLDHAEDAANPDSPFTLLHANAAASAARTGGRADTTALQAWALVHGLAMLMLDGQVPTDERLIDAAVGEDAMEHWPRTGDALAAGCDAP